MKIYSFLLLIFVLALSMSIFLVHQAQFRAAHKRLTQILSIAVPPFVQVPTSSPTPAYEIASPFIQTRTPTTADSAVSCPANGGVYKKSDSSYYFSPLHVGSNGIIYDEFNCKVVLVGINTVGTEFGDGAPQFWNSSVDRVIPSLTKKIPMNIVRLSLNISWWKHNAYVPNTIHLSHPMHYREYVQFLVNLYKNNGYYVMLNRVNDYNNPYYPPCGNDGMGTKISYCPSQSDGFTAQPGDVGYLDDTVGFWQSITPLYKDDPAVMYNIWNEMTIDDNTQYNGVWGPMLWRTYEEQLISTVRAIAPNSIVVLGGNWYNNSMGPVTITGIANFSVPDFTAANLIYDWHSYASSWYFGHISDGQCAQQVKFSQSHGHAIIIGEFNFTSLYNYDMLINFGNRYNSNYAMYSIDNMFVDQNPFALSATGQKIQSLYASLYSGPAPYPD